MTAARDIADPDPAAAVDALVAEIAPGVRPPAVRRCDAIMVTGPWLAGVSAVASALADRLPQWRVVEATDLMPGEVPSAVVFVVSAAAALTDSDCALLDAAAAHTDVVIGVVSKIDVHRQWREMQEAARETLADYAPRYRDVAWVGAAAAPERGDPRVDGLVAELAELLGDGAVERRNRLRSWEFQLRTDADRIDRDARAEGRRARVALLQEQRDEVVRQRRITKSERTIALRSRIAQARVQLAHFARKRCASVRGELAEDAAGMTRRRLPEFEAYVRDRLQEVVAEVDQGVAEHLADVAQELGLSGDTAAAPSTPPAPQSEPGAPALASRRLETQLMTLLGAGFGMGVALTLSRLFAHLAPGLTVAGAVLCVAVGVAVTVWVVHIRGLLRDRAVLDRWVGDAAAALRSALQEQVALRVVAAESALTAELAERNEIEAARAADRIAALDRELREHAAASARAAAVRDRQLPTLQRALAAVRSELGSSASLDGGEATLGLPDQPSSSVSLDGGEATLGLLPDQLDESGPEETTRAAAD
ncbi:hypothetical protein MTER_38780 [Mycolicibacter terrae]|uniref:Uncharacterized protein n=1 Tax=Mycolicibacter terrae TaxID=1788 RepID=A0AAD1HZG7_9MYCO|nr:hypothetical protein [Mycolicibacter terrae]BBX24467.1 hypothetical protein MTER_38780 [Mycolicibacter terrae]SNV53497.1 Conserved membrane protein of uncharacterised function [Mycolicibacter terrae]